MSQVKISQLPAATLPLAGTELLEIVQAGVNKSAPASALAGTPSGGGDYTIIHTDFAVTPVSDLSVAAVTTLTAYTLPGGTLGVKDEMIMESVFVFTSGGTFLSRNKFELLINTVSVAACQIPLPLNAGWAGQVSDAFIKTRVSLQNLGVANKQMLDITIEQALTTTNSTIQNVSVINVFNEAGTNTLNPQPVPLAFRRTLDTTADVIFDWVMHSDGQGLGAMNQFYNKVAQIVGH